MGKYEDELSAVGFRADAEVEAQGEVITRQTQAIESLNQLVEQKDAIITQLRQDLADCQGGTPPQPVSLIGSSVGAPIPGYAPSDLDVIRTYLQPGDRPTSWTSDAKVHDAALNCNIAAWVSGKDAPDTWIEPFFASWNASGKKLIYSQNHEFGNDGPASGTTPPKFPTTAQISEYKRRWELVKQAAVGKPWVILVDCQLGNQSKTEWDKLFIAGLHGLGWDRYNPGIGKPVKGYQAPSVVFGPIIDYAAAKGLPVYIGETGSGIDGTNAAGRVKWAADVKAYLLDKKVAVACWWNQADVVMDAPTAKAWLG